MPAGPGRPLALPSPARLAWLLVQPPTELPASDAALVTRVEQDREAAVVAGLARSMLPSRMPAQALVGQLETGAILEGAEQFQGVAQTGIPRDNH